jgi:hypothetical protein
MWRQKDLVLIGLLARHGNVENVRGSPAFARDCDLRSHHSVQERSGRQSPPSLLFMFTTRGSHHGHHQQRSQYLLHARKN